MHEAAAFIDPAGDQALVTGSYSSAVLPVPSVVDCQPPATRTRPLASAVAVGANRALAMAGAALQLLLLGSKVAASLRPSSLLLDPPTSRARPPASGASAG